MGKEFLSTIMYNFILTPFTCRFYTDVENASFHHIDFGVYLFLGDWQIVIKEEQNYSVSYSQ